MIKSSMTLKSLKYKVINLSLFNEWTRLIKLLCKVYIYLIETPISMDSFNDFSVA